MLNCISWCCSLQGDQTTKDVFSLKREGVGVWSKAQDKRPIQLKNLGNCAFPDNVGQISNAPHHRRSVSIKGGIHLFRYSWRQNSHSTCKISQNKKILVRFFFFQLENYVKNGRRCPLRNPKIHLHSLLVQLLVKHVAGTSHYCPNTENSVSGWDDLTRETTEETKEQNCMFPFSYKVLDLWLVFVVIKRFNNRFLMQHDMW